MAKNFKEFAVLLGVELKCEEELLHDMGFFMACELVVEKLDKITSNIRNNRNLENAIGGLERFKLDLKDGIDKGWLEVDGCQKCIMKADALIDKAKMQLAMGEAIGELH